jgi:TonB-dependent SusC/RagA subfamily outer membrane receptor
MRVLLILPVLAMAAGCDGRRISGPEAQRVVVQAKTAHTSVTSGPLIFVDGVRLVSDQAAQDLDPSAIESIEIVKGTVAKSTYGSEGARGVIFITTKRRVATQASSR